MDLLATATRFPVPGDLVWIDDALDEWSCTVRWDARGLTPTLPSLVSRLWDGVATQRVLLDQHAGPVGLVQLTSVNLLNGSGSLEAIVEDPGPSSDLVAAFAEQVFEDFPLRVVLLHAVADALSVGALLPAAKEVGRLSDYHFRGRGRYEDVCIFELRSSRGPR